MDAATRIDQALATAINGAEAPGCPPSLVAAMRHAVFPRGARIRPRLCLAVAAACGERELSLAAAAAASIELLHCASLVHDDLPCFDDADTRRGRPSVHRAFGQSLAVLTGDALIVLAFQTLARHACPPRRLADLLLIVSSGVGTPAGIVAGQAWECEPKADLSNYHRLKTGALFAAATMAGAAAAGFEASPWRALGEGIGEAFQVADDLRDATATAAELGKPCGKDAALGRPSAVQELGLDGAARRLAALLDDAIASIPPCPGITDLRALILLEAKRLVPGTIAQRAA
ncbi:MAG TPA: polyprenyl synthetase family protein [Vineibacter sp.]|nr:polyprenyl synthetase family protein [Vineibacter sp.]